MSLEQTTELYASVLRQLLPEGVHDTAQSTTVADDVYAHAKVLAQADIDAHRLLQVLEAIPIDLLADYEREYGLPMQCTVPGTLSVEERLNVLRWVRTSRNVMNREYLEQLLAIFGVTLLDVQKYVPMQCIGTCVESVNTERSRFKVFLGLQYPMTADMSCIIEHYLPGYLKVNWIEKQYTPPDTDNNVMKDLVFKYAHDDTYDFYVRYLNNASHTIKVDSVISKPTLADWQQVATAPQIVSVDDLGNVSVNVDYTKAHPYFAYELNEFHSGYMYYGVRTGSGFVDIPYFVMVSDRIKQLATQDPDREDAIMRMEMTIDGEVHTSDILVSDFLYLLEGDFTEDGFNAMLELQSSLEYVAGISSNGAMSLSLLNMDNGEVLETLSFSRNVALTTPDIMNQFKLPIHESLEFTLSEVPLKNVGIFQWSLVGDEWDQTGYRVGSGRQVIGGSNPYIGQTAIATLEDNVIKIQGIEGQSEADVFAVRGITSTAVWLFIPDQHVTITNVSHAVQYDLKHFSNGTVIYFYLAALGE